MATPDPSANRRFFFVQYRGPLKQWKDAIFTVPLEHIYTLSEYPYGSPAVGDKVNVMKRNKSGRMSKWPGLVVSENDVVRSYELDRDDPADSPGPPGSVISGTSSVLSTPNSKKRQLITSHGDGREPAKKKPRIRQQGAFILSLHVKLMI